MLKFRDLCIRAAALLVCITAAPCDIAAQDSGNGAASGYAVRDSVLVVPAGTKKIADRAFADRTDFHTIRFEAPSSLAEIGEYSFLGCINLREVQLPKSLRKIGEGAFRECQSLERVVVPAGVKVIPKQTFAWCRCLRYVSLPESVTDLASHSFVYCESLESIKIPSRLEHIGSNVFSFCTSLLEVSLPATIKELESYAFAECYSLERAVLPANGYLLGELIFSGCRNLKEIVEGSRVPPEFDCNSTLFDAEEEWMYRECVLRVPAASVEAYRRAPSWSLFCTIQPL